MWLKKISMMVVVRFCQSMLVALEESGFLIFSFVFFHMTHGDRFSTYQTRGEKVLLGGSCSYCYWNNLN